MHPHPGWIAALTCIVALSGTASAQTARTGGSASVQLMQQMQQLAAERTALQAENDKLKKQLADITKDRDALKSGQQAVDKRARDASAALAQSNSQRAATDQELTQLKAKMQELVSRFRETIVQLRAAEGESTTAKQTLATRERELATCVDRNKSLYKLNDDVLTHFEKQSAFARMSEIEPFTGIKRTQNENLIDDYRGRAQDQLVSPPAHLPAAPATSAAAAAPPSAAAPPKSPASAAPASAVAVPAGPEPQASVVPATDSPAPH